MIKVHSLLSFKCNCDNKALQDALLIKYYSKISYIIDLNDYIKYVLFQKHYSS